MQEAVSLISKYAFYEKKLCIVRKVQEHKIVIVELMFITSYNLYAQDRLKLSEMI